MNAVVVRLERLSNKELSHQRRHDLRTFKNAPNYIDTTRTHLNSILIQPIANRKKLLEVVSQRRANRKRKLKRDAVLLWSGLIGFGHEAQEKIERLSKDEQDKLFYNVVKAIADYLETDIESLVVHRDETAVHCHFTLFNHTRDGTTLSKKLKPQVLSEIQDLASQVLRENGLDIGRGKKKFHRLIDNEPYSKVVHRTVRQLHRDLPFELEELKERVEKLKAIEVELIEKIKTNEERIKRLQEKIEKYSQDEKAYQEKIAQAEKTLQTYEKRKETAVKEFQEIQEKIVKAEKTLKELKEKIEENDYERKYEEIREKYYETIRTITIVADLNPQVKKLFYLLDPNLRSLFPELVKDEPEQKQNRPKPKSP